MLIAPVDVRETCQNCGRLVKVGFGGRVAEHNISEAGGSPFYPRCCRSRHPSREELARRKAKRAAKRAALVAELLPVADVALDAYLLERPEYADRIGDCRRAALFEFNRRNSTRHRWPVGWRSMRMDDGLFADVWTCRFCDERLGGNRITGGRACGPDYVARVFADHLTECALLYLADQLPSHPVTPGAFHA
jgi:hypothetical protein